MLLVHSFSFQDRGFLFQVIGIIVQKPDTEHDGVFVCGFLLTGKEIQVEQVELTL